uniref:Secreted protein n=1 Tax=Lepeophtheirus salmonis TaxID=72036 RepID=A0A0K2SZZ1_LEPSM
MIMFLRQCFMTFFFSQPTSSVITYRSLLSLQSLYTIHKLNMEKSDYVTSSVVSQNGLLLSGIVFRRQLNLD